jgi:polyferredoxin
MVGGLLFGSKIALVLLMLMMGLSAFLGRSTPLVPDTGVYQGTVWTQEDSSSPGVDILASAKGKSRNSGGTKEQEILIKPYYSFLFSFFFFFSSLGWLGYFSSLTMLKSAEPTSGRNLRLQR